MSLTFCKKEFSTALCICCFVAEEQRALESSCSFIQRFLIVFCDQDDCFLPDSSVLCSFFYGICCTYSFASDQCIFSLNCLVQLRVYRYLKNSHVFSFLQAKLLFPPLLLHNFFIGILIIRNEININII